MSFLRLQKGVLSPFEELVLTSIQEVGPGATFPQIFIGETHVGGCDELYALDREGKLDSLLAGEKANS